jgi:hypothetical protein
LHVSEAEEGVCISFAARGSDYDAVRAQRNHKSLGVCRSHGNQAYTGGDGGREAGNGFGVPFGEGRTVGWEKVECDPFVRDDNGLATECIPKQIAVVTHGADDGFAFSEVVSRSALSVCARALKNRSPIRVRRVESASTGAKIQSGISRPSDNSSKGGAARFSRLKIAVMIPPRSMEERKKAALTRSRVTERSLLLPKVIKHISRQTATSAASAPQEGKGRKSAATEYMPPRDAAITPRSRDSRLASSLATRKRQRKSILKLIKNSRSAYTVCSTRMLLSAFFSHYNAFAK